MATYSFLFYFFDDDNDLLIAHLREILDLFEVPMLTDFQSLYTSILLLVW